MARRKAPPVVAEGRAQAGDLVRGPRGELVEIVEAASAGDLLTLKAEIEARGGWETRAFRGSQLAGAARTGDYTGRERRDLARERQRLDRLYRRIRRKLAEAEREEREAAEAARTAGKAGHAEPRE